MGICGVRVAKEGRSGRRQEEHRGKNTCERLGELGRWSAHFYIRNEQEESETMREREDGLRDQKKKAVRQ